jgi:hypothetical protein
MSGATPRCIFPSNPDDCHPITHIILLRSLFVRRREDERSDAITTDGG